MSESVDEQRMNIYLATTITVLWYICYPIAFAVYYAAIALVFIAKILYRPVGFLLQPLLYLGRFTLACLIAPFELLGRFETVYIYLGIAALVGITIGLAQLYLYNLLIRLLRLDTKPVPQRTRTAREYREAKRKEQEKADAPLISSGLLSMNETSPNQLSPAYSTQSDTARRMKRSKGLLNQTIAEEMSDG
ncbi:hypothetical protein LTR15_005786 [Elasticomyces elasticus]|nr:hypothetical protein LTR15_005786 [Elasticomyces elasticus]